VTTKKVKPHESGATPLLRGHDIVFKDGKAKNIHERYGRMYSNAKAKTATTIVTPVIPRYVGYETSNIYALAEWASKQDGYSICKFTSTLINKQSETIMYTVLMERV